jgi:hypothetical protein
MQNKRDRETLKREAMGRGMAIGMVLFTPFGLVISMLTDNLAFIGVGVPVGVAVGVAIGKSRYQRKMQERGHEGD